ncbi:MAG: O-antigen ligase family protein [Terracidiphilus sp.]
MSPTVALFVWFVLLVAVLYFDPARDRSVSSAIWIPIVWIFIAATRLPSLWIGMRVPSASQALEDGNLLDRTVYLVLIGLALATLFYRSFNWGQFLSRNLVLLAFVAFALISVCWSDFPFVTFKRWFRDLGNYLVILVVLSDRQPVEAIRTLLRRLAFLFLPLSILLFKYYRAIGTQYDDAGRVMYVGPTTGKNLLGVLGLVCILFFFWDTMMRWSQRRARKVKAMLYVDLFFAVMSIWVLHLANSTTCRVCALLGCSIIVAAHSKWGQRHYRILAIVVPASFGIYALLSWGLGMSGELAAVVGKDPTLTDRTEIWAFLLNMHTNPLLGTGYESFWLGSRLKLFWENSGQGQINEAHNGFLEMYLNLGLIGVFLISAILVSNYRKAVRNLRHVSSIAPFSLAFWLVMVFYCVTEAGFRSGLMWSVFLLGTMSVPERPTHTAKTGWKAKSLVALNATTKQKQPKAIA